jgi:glycogen operon protein
VFRRRRWFQGRPIRGTVDIGWFKPDGHEMTDEDWTAGFARAVGLFVNGDAIPGRDPRGQRIVDDSFLILFNAGHEDIDWTLPSGWGTRWELVLDTTPGPVDAHDEVVTKAGEVFPVDGRSVTVLRRLGSR